VNAVRAIKSRISPKRLVRAQAHAFPRESHPDRAAAAFHGARQRAIVDHFRANRRKSANVLQRRSPAAGRNRPQRPPSVP